MFEIMKTIELEPIIPNQDEGESFKFRIEILKKYDQVSHFFPRVYRWETFRIQPTFPQIDGNPKNEFWDHFILVEDDAQDWESIKGKTVESVIRKTIKKITDIFNCSYL